MNARAISVVDAGQLDDAQFQNLISGMEVRRSPLWALFVALMVATLVLAGCGKATSASGGSTATEPEQPAATATATEVEDDEPQAYSPEEISELLEPSTVQVIAEGEGWAMTGTGFIYDEDSGLIMTNTHVIEGAASVKIYFAGSTRMYPAHIVGRSTCDDISVVQINTKDLQEVAIGDSDELVVGQEVMALGYPLASMAGEEITLTRGIVGRLHVDASIWDDAIQVDAAINPGNSGGPLVNVYGEVVGVNSAGVNAAIGEGMNYAVSINHAMAVADLLEVEGDHNWLGLELIPNSPELAAEYGLPTDQGMVVTFVAPGGPADEIGLEAGDVILKMQGQTVTSMDQVCNIVRTHSLENVRLDIVEYGTDDADDAGQDADDADQGADDDQTGDDQDGDNGQDDGDDSQTDDDQNDDDNQNDGDQAQDGDGGADGGQTGASFREDLYELLISNGFELIDSTDFANGDPGSFWTGESDNGGQASVTEDGWYLFEIPGGSLQLAIPDSAANLADGAFVTDVHFVPGDSTAAAGILARINESSDLYYCTIITTGETGCYLYAGGQWQELFMTAPGEIPVYELNTLALLAVGPEFVFQVNGQAAGSFSDSTLSIGGWGLVGECFDSACAIAFDYADVYSVGSGTTGDQAGGQQGDTADDGSANNGGNAEYLLRYDFEDGDTGPWYVGSGDGYSFGIDSGWYMMSLADGYYITNLAHYLGDVQDAAISAEFAIEGSGTFGLVGRYSQAGEEESYYLCWVTPTGQAGCDLVVNGERQSLIYAEGVQLAEVNTMTMAISGNTLIFGINGQEIGTTTDNTLATGLWGMFLSGDGGQMTALVDYIEMVALTS